VEAGALLFPLKHLRKTKETHLPQNNRFKFHVNIPLDENFVNAQERFIEGGAGMGTDFSAGISVALRISPIPFARTEFKNRG